MTKPKKRPAPSAGEVVSGELITFRQQLTKLNANDNPKTNALEDYREQILQRHFVCMIFGVNHLKSMIHCGEALLEVKDMLKHGQFKKWIASSFGPETGLSLRTCQRYMAKAREFRKFLEKMELAIDPEATFLSFLDDNDLFMAFADQFATSGNIVNSSEEWKTPNAVLEAVRKTMGSIDCDPCASPHFSIVGPDGVSFDKDSNGLELSNAWRGNVFVSLGIRSSILPWLEKAKASVEDGNAKSVIGFFPAQFSAAVMRLLVGSPICLLDGPLTTVIYEDEGRNVREFALPQEMAATFIGQKREVARFTDAFAKLGTTFVPMAQGQAKDHETKVSANPNGALAIEASTNSNQ